MPERNTFAWRTFEYEEKERSVDWFWAVGIIGLTITIISFLYDNYMFGIMIFIGIACLIYFNARTPRELTISISNRGIRIEQELYVYQNIRNFWIEPQPRSDGRYHLILLTRRFFMPAFSIPLPQELDAGEVRNFLLEYIEEKEIIENPAYEFMEKIGF